MKDKNKIREEQKQTPVSDGDTRPDHQPEGQRAEPFPLIKNIKNKVSEGRAADTDSLEDFKDSNTQSGDSAKSLGQTSPVPGGAGSEEA